VAVWEKITIFGRVFARSKMPSVDESRIGQASDSTRGWLELIILFGNEISQKGFLLRVVPTFSLGFHWSGLFNLNLQCPFNSILKLSYRTRFQFGKVESLPKFFIPNEF